MKQKRYFYTFFKYIISRKSFQRDKDSVENFQTIRDTEYSCVISCNKQITVRCNLFIVGSTGIMRRLVDTRGRTFIFSKSMSKRPQMPKNISRTDGNGRMGNGKWEWDIFYYCRRYET